MSNPLTIALVSSAENTVASADVRNELLAHGHIVSEITAYAATQGLICEGYTVLFGRNEQAFNDLTILVGMADLLVLLLPVDQDAACLAGMAQVAGIPVAVISNDSEQGCGFVLCGCVNFWCENTAGLLEIIRGWPDLGDEAERDLWRAVREEA
jgi:hypothetical protein